VRIIAGNIGDIKAPAPAPDSWAADEINEVAIWLIKLETQFQVSIPAASYGINRSLYFYKGSTLKIADIEIHPYHSVDLLPEEKTFVQNGQTLPTFCCYKESQLTNRLFSMVHLL